MLYEYKENIIDLSNDILNYKDEILSLNIRLTKQDIYPRYNKYHKRFFKRFSYNPYVYVLWDNDEIIYIGSTIDFRNRMGKHRTSSMIWNGVSNIECKTKIDAMILECILIKRFEPKYNKLGLE